VDVGTKRVLSLVDEAYHRLMKDLINEAKDGPRLFSFAPVDPGFLDHPKWASARFRLTLWCEHSRQPLPMLNGAGAALRQLHAWLKAKDPAFGGLVRVRNKLDEVLWVHPQFAQEY
jgi:hypothetical protein